MLEPAVGNVLAILGWVAAWLLLVAWRQACNEQQAWRKLSSDYSARLLEMEQIGPISDRLMSDNTRLMEQNARVIRVNRLLAERVAQQSELLSKAAEREQEAARRLGYLFPRGLETPPSVEDALSPTWCRQEPKSGINYRPASAEEFDELVAAFREAPDALPREAV